MTLPLASELNTKTEMRENNRISIKGLIGVYLLFTCSPVWASSLTACFGLLGLKSISESIAGLLKNTPDEKWSESPYLVRDQENSYWIEISETLQIRVEFWSKHGNPVIKIDSVSDEVIFRPTQPDLPNWLENVRRGGDITDITRRDPVFAIIDPNLEGEKPNIIVTDGHHRFMAARTNALAVYIEIGSVRSPHPWEIRSGHWFSNPIF